MVDLTLNVFVSSRSDLLEQRRAAAAAIEESGHRVDSFEDWPALSQPPLDASIAAAEGSDIVVLLLGATYGPLATTGRSITHEEYRAARAKQVPVLPFRIGTELPEPMQSEFISEVRAHQTVHAVASIDALKTDIQQAISAEVVRRFRAPQHEALAATRIPEVGLAAERRMSITIDAQADAIESLRNALTRKAGEKLNETRAVFRAGQTTDAIAMLDDLRREPEWNRIDVDVRARVLTTLAAFHRATGGSADVAGLVQEAKALDPHADYLYFDALLRYDSEGADRALELLGSVQNTRTFNLKLALLLELGRMDDASQLLQQPPEPISTDVETDRLRAFVAFAKGDVGTAIGILDVALKTEPRSESLRVASAIVNIASTITPEERPLHAGPWLPPIDPAFVMTSPEMLSRLEKAAATLNDVIRDTQRSGEPFEQMCAWRLAAIALHPARRDDARAVAAEMLELDPGDPAALVWSTAFGFDVDVERAEVSLSDAAREPLTPPRVIAVVAAVEHQSEVARAEAILDRYRATFDGEEDLWRFWKVRLLAVSDRFDEAATLADEISVDALRRASEWIVSESRAKTTGQWDEFLDVVDRLDPGYRALAIRARLGRWDEIVDQTVTLVEQVPLPATVKLAATALFRVRRNTESLRMLHAHEDLWSRAQNAPELYRLTIQNQIVVGELINALKGAERLFGVTNSGYDLMLIIHAAMSAGRRKDARFWASRLLGADFPEVRAEDFLQIAQTIAIEDRDVGRELWKRADKIGFTTEMLPAAMQLAMKLGLNDESQRAAQSALAAGLFREATADEFVEMQKARSAALADTVRSYAEGELPLAILLAATGRPLAEVYEMQLLAGRRNAVGSTPPLYIRHGGRMLSAHLSLKRVRSLTLDISTILLADAVGVLDAIEKRFKTLRISSVACAALAEQQGLLQSSQPTVDAAFATIMRLFDEKRLSELKSVTPMQAAHDNVGHLVAEFEHVVTAATGAKLYLTTSSAVDLAQRDVLERLGNEHAVIIEEGTISLARHHVEKRQRRDALAARLATLSERIGAGLSSSKYRVFATTGMHGAESDLDLTVHALGDFFRATGESRHAFVVDDRFASSQLALAGSPVITLMNVLAELRASKQLSDEKYFLVLLQLRRANYRFIDLDADEIVHWLTKATVTGEALEESEPLQVLRVYLNSALSDRNIRIIPLPQTNPKGRALGEGAFAANSSFATVRALSQIWSLTGLSVERRTAVSDWILRSLYTGTYGVHHLYGEGFKAARVLMAEDLGGLLTTFFGLDLSLVEAASEWVQSRIVAHRLHNDPDMFADITETVKKHLLYLKEPSEPDRKFRNRMIRAVFSVLPSPMRIVIAKDAAFVRAVDLRARSSITAGGFSFAEDAFWNVVDELCKKNEVALQDDTGHHIRITRAPGDDGLYFNDGTGQNFFPNDTFVVLAFKTEEEQRKHLREHPEIFDVPDDALDAAIDEILALPTGRERAERYRDVAKNSAAAQYAGLRILFGRADHTFDDLLPPSDALLRHYLPGYAEGKELDSAAAFAPLVERADLLDVLRRAAVMPIPLPEKLRRRFAAEPDERRREILSALRVEAASPVMRAHLAILAFASGTEADRSLALELVDELAGSPTAARQTKLFRSVLRFVYWRFSRDPRLAPDVRLLLAWAHTARLVGIFVATESDVVALREDFVEMGETFPDDFWARTPPSLDVLHPWTVTALRTVAAALAHVATSVQNENDATEVARRLATLIYPKKVVIPIPLMRDLTLGTNATDSFLAADLSEPLIAVNLEGASVLSVDARLEILTRAMRSIDDDDNSSVGWLVIDAIIGNLPPPPEVRSWLRQLVLSPKLDAIVASDTALAAFSVLANLEAHFDDDYRQRVEDLAVSSVTHWQKKDRDAASLATDANRWTMVGVTLAARPESREQTGAALGRILRRFIDAAPAIAPFAATMLTILPFQMPMDYLPALWPAVIFARGTPRIAIP